MLPQNAVVQRASLLTPGRQASIVQTAVKLDRGNLDSFPAGSIAVPLVNTLSVFPAARESSTTAITYLGYPSSIGTRLQAELTQRYADLASASGVRADPTGLVPGTTAEGNAIHDNLRWVEIASVLLVALIIGLYLRSVTAPLVTLLSAAVLYVVTMRVVSFLVQHAGFRLHHNAEPIVVVLLLGVITDYSVFFLSGVRTRLLAGQTRLDAARMTTAEFLPIIFTAGVLVSLGLATLRIAGAGFVQALGPGLAIVVLLSLCVALTFTPALLAVLGGWAFWPALGKQPDPQLVDEHRRGGGWRRRLAEQLTKRWVAVIVATLVALSLAAAASGLYWVRLGLTPIRGLPDDSPPHRAEIAASKGFAAGIVSPTEVVVQKRGVNSDDLRLAELARRIDHVPGVAFAVGAGIPGIPPQYDVFRVRGKHAVRYLTVFEHSPFSSDAVADLERLQRAMPGILRASGLGGARALYVGDTPIARDSIDKIHHDLWLVGIALFGVNLVLLAVFLRALVAPLYLVAASILTLAATFGLTVLFFQRLLGYGEITYFVPLAVGVLLVSFGSDYNIFVVGRVWQEAQTRSIRAAILEAGPRASRAITVAGLALAFSFAVLAIVPLRSFREFAFSVSVGVLIDTFVVRSLLIPTLLTVFGDLSWWPFRGRRADV